MVQVTRVLLIGLGSIGRRHLRVLKEIDSEIEIVLVRSGVGPQCAEQSLAIAVHASIEKAMNFDIDAAIIAGPASRHLEYAIELLKFKIPIFMEKPLFDSMPSLEIINRFRHSIFLVGYVLRHNPAAQFFSEFLSDGRLGQLLFVDIISGSYLPDWRPNQDYRISCSANRHLGGGVLTELSHEIDLALWFFGTCSSLTASLRNSGSLELEVEDIAQINLQMESGIDVRLHLDFCRRTNERRCIVYGENGTLEWDLLSKQVSFRDVSGDIDLRTFNLDRDAVYELQMRHFLDVAGSGAESLVTFEDGLSVVKVIDAARQASGSCVRVDL